MTETGRIYKGVGGFYYVKTADRLIECKARGRFRLDKITPMVGDMTKVELLSHGDGYLQEILPRNNSFIRPPVANIEILLIVASAAPPVTDLFLVDRMSAVAVNKGIVPVVLINKCDIDRGDAIKEAYTKSGIDCIQVSAVTGEGRELLLERIAGKLVAFSGNSGVGKTSLLNMIDPRKDEAVGDLNIRLGRGRHTTRHVELFDLPNGATVADTPGFSSFETDEVDIILKDDLQYAFLEFEPYLGNCQYVGCSHRTDSNCAVRQAVESGEIARSRYESYLRMYEEAKLIKEWELK